MKTVIYSVPNISCNHCVNTIQNELSEVEGVTAVSARADTKQVTITFAPPATEEALLQLLAEINYPAAENG